MAGGRAILVTGCSSGIGAYCARALRKEGWEVFATARKQADLAALAADGLNALYLDYREPDSIAACLDDVLRQTGGRLDALFNNGAHSQPGAVEDLPMEALREQFEVNFFGWHDLTRRVVPVMRSQGHGRLVHCSSILGLVPMKWRGAYNASKFALEGLMLTLRMELAGSGLHVSLIEPGPVPSKIAQNALAFVDRYIDVENSVHRDAYRRRLAELRAGGTAETPANGPHIVHAALRHALESAAPRPHYVVTRQAKVGVALKRLLPPAFFYRLLGRQP